MQRLQGHDQLSGRTIRVGDDVLLGKADDRIGVHFRNDQRHVGIVAPGRGIIDHDAVLGADLGSPFLGDGAAGGHQADVGVGEVVVLQRLYLQRLVAEGDLGALRTTRRQRYDFVGRKATFRQNVEHLPANIARGARDCDLVTHIEFPHPSPPLEPACRSCDQPAFQRPPSPGSAG